MPISNRNSETNSFCFKQPVKMANGENERDVSVFTDHERESVRID